MSAKCVKLTELIKSNSSFSYSMEVTPEVDLEEINTLAINPLFYSITWHAKSHQCKNLDIPPLQLAERLASKGLNVLLHLSCDLLTKNYLKELLGKLLEINVRNLFVVLGEQFDTHSSEFKDSKELISHIRAEMGGYFCIGVVGFPDHDDVVGRIKILKDKIDSGADFIITQAIFESPVFLKYVERCREMGIFVPILAGMYHFETTQQLQHFVDLCKVKVSEYCLNHINQKINEAHSVFTGSDYLKTLIHNVEAVTDEKIHFHFFTMNKIKNVSDFIKKIQAE